MYKSSGLAEIVREPSPITLKYLNTWFTGSGAFGTALTMLGWPVFKTDEPILVWDEKHGLRIDLKIEEKTMYSKTILRYVKIDDDYQVGIDYKKILSIKKVINTICAIWSQSKLLINYQKTYDLAKSYVTSIPTNIAGSKKDIEDVLQLNIWPKLIAVDYMGEFIYSAMTNKLSPEDRSALIQKLQARISPIDWYTKGVLAWADVQDKTVNLDEFVSEYGFIAGDDYELTKLRYYELLKKPKPKVSPIKLENMNISTIEDLYVGLQYLRSQAKRTSLIWISALRDEVVEN